MYADSSHEVRGREEAVRLDRADPTGRFRDRFHLPAAPGGHDGVYLCGHSLGLQPRSVAARVEHELQRWAQRGIRAYFEEPTPWYPYHETVRPALARLVGATPEEVVAMNALTVNLHLMLATFYRPTATRRRILIEAGAFPSDRYAVMSHIELHRFDPDDTLVTVAPRDGERTLRTDDIESLLDRQGDEIALVLLPGVQFQTGQRLDLQRIAATARRCGCRVGFDLAHAVGNVPLALHDWNVDFAVWCSYKYLNAGPGAVAGCFVHARHDASHGLPRLAGWWGTDPDTRFVMRPDDRFVPQRGAAGWQVSNPPILALAPLGASLEMFDELGLDALRDRSLRLTGWLTTLLGDLGPDLVEIVTPLDPESRGAQLSLRWLGDDPQVVVEELATEGIVCDFREPDVIRVAPVPLYNTFLDVWRFVDALRRRAHR
ncbi:MAG: kynureninase [Acidobacteria bacterium]|nr:kynureninase [Acidobacteriota bacterium]